MKWEWAGWGDRLAAAARQGQSGHERSWTEEGMDGRWPTQWCLGWWQCEAGATWEEVGLWMSACCCWPHADE